MVWSPKKKFQLPNKPLLRHNNDMSIEVRIPTILRPFTKDEKVVAATGTSLTELIADLDQQYPGIADRLLENGALRRFINIYINDEDVRFLGSLEAQIKDGDSVTILPAVAGG
jgi:molybdopterin converting factor small subunit